MLPLQAISLRWGQRAMTHIYISLSHGSPCDEAADLFTHEDDFHKVFCDHSSNQRKLNIIHKQLSNEEPCLNTQNPHWNNQGVLLET